MAGRQHIAGGCEPGDVTGAGHLHSGIGAMGAPGSEIGDAPSLGSPDAARRLGGEGGLQVHLVDDIGFYELGLDNGGGDFQQRLIGEVQPSVGDRANAAGEPHTPQVVKKFGSEGTKGAQVVYGFVVELQAGKVV